MVLNKVASANGRKLHQINVIIICTPHFVSIPCLVADIIIVSPVCRAVIFKTAVMSVDYPLFSIVTYN